MRLVTKLGETDSVNNKGHKRSLTVLNTNTVSENKDQLTALQKKSVNFVG